MECYCSEPRDSLELCLQWVAQAHALVVIVGFKAGSLIPEFSDLTYTAAEVDAARLVVGDARVRASHITLLVIGASARQPWRVPGKR